jgi:hypothetical protein
MRVMPPKNGSQTKESKMLPKLVFGVVTVAVLLNLLRMSGSITKSCDCANDTQNIFKSSNDTQIPFNSSIDHGGTLQDPLWTYSCPSSKKKSEREEFQTLVAILDGLDCPFFLHAGLLLNFARDCEFHDVDIDFAIPQDWMTANRQRLSATMKAHGYNLIMEFGQVGTFGYEMAWKKNGRKTDMFTVEDHSGAYHSALYLTKGENQFMHRCITNNVGIQEFQWGNTTIRAPYPFDMALRSMYGVDWRKPYPGTWHWFHSATTVGSCNKTWEKTFKIKTNRKKNKKGGRKL